LSSLSVFCLCLCLLSCLSLSLSVFVFWVYLVYHSVQTLSGHLPCVLFHPRSNIYIYILLTVTQLFQIYGALLQSFEKTLAQEPFGILRPTTHGLSRCCFLPGRCFDRGTVREQDDDWTGLGGVGWGGIMSSFEPMENKLTFFITL
jgi:hypothetical protein